MVRSRPQLIPPVGRLPREAVGAFGVRRLLTFSRTAYGPPTAMLPRMLEDDRRRAGWSVGQVAWRLGASVREYRETLAEQGDGRTLCRLYDWPQMCASEHLLRLMHGIVAKPLRASTASATERVVVNHLERGSELWA